MSKRRKIFFYKNYFASFYEQQTDKVKKKVLWTLRVIEELEQIPENYLKHVKNTTGLYEIRVQLGNNIFRIFCFFDAENLVVVGHGFQKKSQKTDRKQIEKAERIKRAYYETRE